MTLVDTKRDDIVARQRARKAGRLVNHLDTYLGHPATEADVADWRERQWKRLFERYNERWNTADPWPTVDATIARLRLRDRLTARKAAVAV